MTDPYKVLGISPNATDEQVKAAYRELAKKYHPDNYANNPLSDLAEEKMQEINQAYDAIVAQRRAGGQSGGYSGGAYAQGASQFADIRRMINSGTGWPRRRSSSTAWPPPAATRSGTSSRAASTIRADGSTTRSRASRRPAR